MVWLSEVRSDACCKGVVHVTWCGVLQCGVLWRCVILFNCVVCNRVVFWCVVCGCGVLKRGVV